MCWPNPSHTSEDTKCISTRVEKAPLSRRGHNIYLNLCWPSSSHGSEDTKCISNCVDQTRPMTARTQNESQRVLTKPLSCQRVHKMHLIMGWPNSSLASEYTKFISTRVDQTEPIPARPLKVSQHVLTIHIPCKQGHKMSLNTDDETQPMLAITQNASQHALTNPLPCQWVHKKPINLCWPTQPMPARP